MTEAILFYGASGLFSVFAKYSMTAYTKITFFVYFIIVAELT